MSATSKPDTNIKQGEGMVICPTIASLRNEPVTAADWLEGAVWLAVCLIGFWIGGVAYDATPMSMPITVLYGTGVLSVAVWTMKRQRARGIRRWF